MMQRGGKIVKYTEVEKNLILAAEYDDLKDIAIQLKRPLKGIVEAARRWAITEGNPTNLVFPKRRGKTGPRRQDKQQEPVRRISPLLHDPHTGRPDWFVENLNIRARR